MFQKTNLAALAFLLVPIAAVMSSPQCSSVISSTCLQKCNDTSCYCGGNGARRGSGPFEECNQVCHTTSCEKVTCSASTCIQSCHGCQMECTSDATYCNQRCLSGTCVLKCSAGKCVQNCKAGKCTHLSSDDNGSRSVFPRPYLVALACLFAATAVLSFTALVMACCNVYSTRQRNQYFRLRTSPGHHSCIYVPPTCV